MATVAIGGPVNRLWPIEYWLTHQLCACSYAGVTPEIVWGYPSWDEELRKGLLELSATHGRSATLIPLKEPQRVDNRVWNPDRYQTMTEARNAVLQVVRDDIQPEAYGSIDTDIFLHEHALALALEQLANFDAVGMRSFMSPPPDKSFPSHGALKGEQIYNRIDAETGTFRTACIMAAKVLGPAAMMIEYKVATSGEDIGWSLNATAAGLRLGWCADAKAKHAMDESMLDFVDPRLNF